MDNFEFKFDELKLQKCRNAFIDWLRDALGRNIEVGDIKIYCTTDGKFSLKYVDWDCDDQIKVERLCYPDTSFDTIIEIHSATYDTKIRRND